MKAVIQRVVSGSVEIDGVIYSQIGKGLVVFVGFEKDDKCEVVNFLADKMVNLRIFDKDGKMSLSVIDIEGEILLVSQFTLAGDTSKGRRPDFTKSLQPDIAKEYYNSLVMVAKRELGENKVMTGVFGSNMKVNIKNNGPVTIIIEK